MQILMIFVIAIILIVIFLFLLARYFYNFAIARNEKAFLLENDDLSPISENEEQEAASNWYEKTSKTPLTIDSSDGLTLYGVWLKQSYTSHKWAICVHGYSTEHRALTRYGKLFFEEGCNVVLIDLRGHGESQGDYIGMGHYDRFDVLKWVEKIVNLDQNAQIVLMGVSMGAATVLMASGENLLPNVKCVVEDCGFINAYEQMSYQFKRMFPKLPAFPILAATNAYCMYKAGYRLASADALEAVKHCKLPVLFIHGDEDAFVPVDMVYRLYEAAKCEKELFVVKGAKHVQSLMVAGKEYHRKVGRFLEKYINQ